jgi:uncharacterized membrane protein
MKFIRNILIFDGVPIAVYVILSSKIESLPKAFYLFALIFSLPDYPNRRTIQTINKMNPNTVTLKSQQTEPNSL